MKKSASIIAVLLTATLAVGLSGCGGGQDQIDVKTAVAKTGQIQSSIDITGALVPAQAADLSAPFSGKVAEVNVKPGDMVAMGQVLAALDVSQLNAQLNQAQANYQGSQSSLAQAKISLDNAKITLDRSKSLFNEGAVSKLQLDNDQKAYDLAKAQYNSSITAGSGSAQASLDSVRVQIQNASIKSPFAGILVSANITAGENATMGSSLFTVADMSILKLKGTVPQEALPYIKKGDSVDLYVDIYPEIAFHGSITDVGTMSVSTGTYFPVEISFTNTEELASGLSAHATIMATGKPHVIVPASALVENNGESYLFLIQDGVAKKQIVTTGLRNDSEVEIIQGLSADASIAVTNANHLFDDMPVHVVEE